MLIPTLQLEAVYTVTYKNKSLTDQQKKGCSTFLKVYGERDLLDFRPVDTLYCSVGTGTLATGKSVMTKSGNNCPTGMTKTKLADNNEKCSKLHYASILAGLSYSILIGNIPQ